MSSTAIARVTVKRDTASRTSILPVTAADGDKSDGEVPAAAKLSNDPFFIKKVRDIVGLYLVLTRKFVSY